MFRIRMARRKARILSKYSTFIVVANLGEVSLGRYENGKRLT